VTAFHEAAHAVVAYRLGPMPTQVNLWIRRDGDRYGVFGTVHQPGVASATYAYRMDQIAIALAGLAGEGLLGIARRNHDPRDREIADGELDQFRPPLTELRRARILAREYTRARAIVRRDVALVKAIADALLTEAREQRERVGPWRWSVTLEGDRLEQLLLSATLG
jgi:hypothetical protein